MKVETSIYNDIVEIFRLYDLATNYQRIIFPKNTWPKFGQLLIETEIQEKRQFKIVIENQIACVWAITFTDPQIWEVRNIDPSIYIHRIATNPDFRGRNFVAEIVNWARGYAALHKKNFIRLDTCGNNKKLIRHYTLCGFDFLGMVQLQNADDLPIHYHNVEVCLFQISL